MAHWLYKTEPSSWSWDEQVAAGEAGTGWSGVRNHQAKRHLMAMRRGERGFFYHSGEAKAVVGIVEVIVDYAPDPTDATGRFGMVELKAVEPLPQAVSLAAIKARPELAGMVLVNNSRLSVQPVSEAEWTLIRQMGGL